MYNCDDPFNFQTEICYHLLLLLQCSFPLQTTFKFGSRRQHQIMPANSLYLAIGHFLNIQTYTGKKGFYLGPEHLFLNSLWHFVIRQEIALSIFALQPHSQIETEQKGKTLKIEKLIYRLIKYPMIFRILVLTGAYHLKQYGNVVRTKPT